MMAKIVRTFGTSFKVRLETGKLIWILEEDIVEKMGDFLLVELKR